MRLYGETVTHYNYKKKLEKNLTGIKGENFASCKQGYYS